jgi:hypothetical protein
MKSDNGEFRLPENAKEKLAEIFTEEMIPAVEAACRHYLHATAKQETRPSIPEDGRALIAIAEKASELRELLRQNRPALKRVHRHYSDDCQKRDTLLFVDDLKKRLRSLEGICEINPAAERAATPKRGRPAGTKNSEEWMLAVHLWEIYRAAHKRTPARIVDGTDGKETGPMPRAVETLAPLLGVGSNLSGCFREIEKNAKAMENKSPKAIETK